MSSCFWCNHLLPDSDFVYVHCHVRWPVAIGIVHDAGVTTTVLGRRGCCGCLIEDMDMRAPGDELAKST